MNIGAAQTTHLEFIPKLILRISASIFESVYYARKWKLEKELCFSIFLLPFSHVLYQNQKPYDFFVVEYIFLILHFVDVWIILHLYK